MQAQGILARAAIAPAPTARGRQCRVSAATVAVAPPAVLSRVTHSMPPEKAEVFRSLEGWASSSLLALLKPIEDFWQPTDFLPESSSEMFEHEVRDLRARATGLPDEYFVVLVGDMVTEEALPTYQAMTRRGPARAPGRCGRAPGPPRRTATVTSSASTCTSPAASACAWSRRPFSTSLVPAWYAFSDPWLLFTASLEQLEIS
jgi:hypothetical protein